MALAAVYTAMHFEEPKSVHPFFSKPSKTQAPEPETHDAITNHDSLNDDPQYALQHTSPQTTKTQQKRARKATHTKNQPSLESFARRPTPEVTNVDLRARADDLAGPSLEEDLNLDRRKRRKTTSPEPNKDVIDTTQTAQELPSELYHQLHTEAASVGTQEVIDDIMGESTLVANTPKDDTPVSSLPRIVEGVHEDTVPESSLPQQPAEGQSRSTTPPTAGQHAVVVSNEGPPPDAADNTTAKVTPKKQIKVTKTGKLVSSPPKPDPSISTTPKKRGRPRKAAKKANLSATITIIRYGSDNASRLAFGQQIDAILSGEKSSKRHTVVVPPKLASPPKAPHPFFTGKAGQKKVEAQNKPDAESHFATPRKSAITPGKLLAERRKEQIDEPTPAFGISRNNRSVKQSGLHEPSWPSKETAHVRNLDGENASQPSTGPSTAGISLKPAKLKSNVYTLPVEEEVITRLAQQLSEDMKTKPNKTYSDFAPPEDVRLPTRSLTTGIDIQRKVRAQIRAPVETLAQRLYAKTHPAITTLYDDIEHTLTPFDEGICELQAWAQKYRPGQANHVLQTGNEAFALQDWLQSLTVMAVGAGQDPPQPGSTLDTKRPPKKKRKTVVDNFIVSDDENEEEEMVELDINRIAPPHQAPSLRRLRWTRNKNVVLLSGPHGCGKSATVYAVAKELDFEVFELHSGIRRSGKDIQDKVGDMTANHLVNHKRNDLPVKKVAPIAVDVDTDNERISTEFQKDLDSGRQGTMTSFFTAKPPAKPKPKPKPKAQVVVKSPAKTRTTPIAQATIPLTHSSRKSQKQSLILIEEADILFEEDQSFWTQIIKLAAQSKRPIVITCNDESQIPTPALPVAAILRLTPPPTDLATDYLVALAGREGHVLQRQAISDLYNAKGHDLRASITEMNFWCQMSVGDKKGGLEWMYQRWPPGKDVNVHGRLLRVASEDTYRSGMGWLSHNVFEAIPNIAFNKEVELLTEVWNDWGISPMSCNIEAQPTTKSAESDQAAEFDISSQLDQLVTFSDALSASDIFCRVGLPTYEDMYNSPIDATLPSITDKERLSYTIDAPLLQADHQTDYLALDTSLATQTHLLIHQNFPHLVHRHGDSSSSTSTSLEQYYTHQILRHQTHNRADHNLTRSDCASAFDILASPSDQDHFIDHRTTYNLTPSSFDRTLSIIALDLAPYIRSIVAHEQGLEAQRLRLGNLLSEGGRAKRQRTTRASRTAMEGGERQSKRRERWFSRDLNFELVMRTAGSEWAGLGWKGEGAEEEEISLTGTQNSEGLSGTQRSGEEGVEMLVDAEE